MLLTLVILGVCLTASGIALYDQSMPSLASTAPIGTLVPGTVSPQRPVPASIPRPEYVGKPGPAKFTGSEVKPAETIEKIRIASRIAAQAIVEVGKHIQP